MATRQILQRLADEHAVLAGQRVAVESVGGVEAARRVAQASVRSRRAAGDALAARGTAASTPRAGWRWPLGDRGAVREGAPRPDRHRAGRAQPWPTAVRSIFDRPSGRHLEALFAAGARPTRSPRASAGAPRRAGGEPGGERRSRTRFQQGSELLGQPGIVVLGPLPDAVQAVTVFGAALGTTVAPARADAARRLLPSSPRRRPKPEACVRHGAGVRHAPPGGVPAVCD
ncbi:molybdenum ABC transporter substrate-binding protein [Burkholderia plantarii]|uniref:molybdenum ABC transporter substrate-binding protein n=1 Tax=Burkholderia plantarii TaxID=41899 RepID=UPI0018DB1787|nr:molybdenum ABC transporter substrate-binding protein [Burkholderia plantarii]MBI0329020.1 molybdenum ABC transporter substrate-binding protein [Burkholderia plantarii]